MVVVLGKIPMPSRKERVSFVISEEEKRILERLAAMESRTVSNYLVTLVRGEAKRAREEGRLDNDRGRVVDLDILGNPFAGNLAGKPTNEMLPPPGTLGGR